MGNLFEKVASPEAINDAWKYFCRDKAPWQPGISRRDFDKNAIFYLLKLAEELHSEDYKPDPIRQIDIYQGNGKSRNISIFSLRDKVVQRAILSVINPIGENVFHPCSFAYRPGRSVDMALKQARDYIRRGLTWGIHGDIEDCFTSILHKALKKTLKQHISDKQLIHIIMCWIEKTSAKKGFLCSARGIPQGAILSPFLCNLYLTSLDNDLTAAKIPFVRYADDMLLFSTSHEEAEMQYQHLIASLSSLKLQLNQKKVLISRCNSKMTFLGQPLFERIKRSDRQHTETSRETNTRIFISHQSIGWNYITNRGIYNA